MHYERDKLTICQHQFWDNKISVMSTAQAMFIWCQHPETKSTSNHHDSLFQITLHT